MTANRSAHVRRAILAASIAFAGVPHAVAADLTARDVTLQFHKAEANTRVDFSGKNLTNLDLAGLDFKSANLAKANLYGADLTSANMKGTDLSGAKLDRAILMQTDFSGANLQGATILLPSIFSDTSFKHADAPKFVGANLRGARIAARMDGADFANADLSGAWIGPSERTSEAGMAPSSRSLGMNFTSANLSGAMIKEVEMTFARFTGANLKGAKLINLDLTRADFSGSDMTGADITGSNLDGANLSGVKGFETVTGLASVKNIDKAIRE